MFITVEKLLSKTQVASLRESLDAASWVDGKVTAGSQSGMVKHNQQLPENSTAAQQAGLQVLDALARHPVFISAALPQKIFPPLFNRYRGGENFGVHVDNAIRHVPDSAVRLRTDLSATLFLSEPEEYEGGELIIHDHFGGREVKLAAGDMILYPATTLHEVRPVTKGARTSSFFWIQSMVRDGQQREQLFELDQAIQALTVELGSNHSEVVRLSGVYHNLVRRWADA